MKEDMLNSSSDDDANEYKDSEIKYGNLEAVEEAERESSDDETDDEESSNDEETDMDDYVYGGFAFVQDVLCSMHDKPAIPESWILLDSQCTVDVFSNPRLLENIHDAKQVLTLHCNAGKAIVTKKGDLKGYGTV